MAPTFYRMQHSITIYAKMNQISVDTPLWRRVHTSSEYVTLRAPQVGSRSTMWRLGCLWDESVADWTTFLKMRGIVCCYFFPIFDWVRDVCWFGDAIKVTIDVSNAAPPFKRRIHFLIYYSILRLTGGVDQATIDFHLEMIRAWWFFTLNPAAIVEQHVSIDIDMVVVVF